MTLARLFLTAPILLALTACISHKGTIKLTNNSKEPIATAKIEICHQTINLKELPPTRSKTESYEVKGDSHFKIEITLQSGKTLRKEDGYVTNGMDFEHEISVTDTEIRLTETTGR